MLRDDHGKAVRSGHHREVAVEVGPQHPYTLVREAT